MMMMMMTLSGVDDYVTDIVNAINKTLITQVT